MKFYANHKGTDPYGGNIGVEKYAREEGRRGYVGVRGRVLGSFLEEVVAQPADEFEAAVSGSLYHIVDVSDGGWAFAPRFDFGTLRVEELVFFLEEFFEKQQEIVGEAFKDGMGFFSLSGGGS